MKPLTGREKKWLDMRNENRRYSRWFIPFAKRFIRRLRRRALKKEVEG